MTSSFGQDSFRREAPWSPLPSPGTLAGPLTPYLLALTFTPCCPFFFMGQKEVRGRAQGEQRLELQMGFIWEPRLLLSPYFGTPTT